MRWPLHMKYDGRGDARNLNYFNWKRRPAPAQRDSRLANDNALLGSGKTPGVPHLLPKIESDSAWSLRLGQPSVDVRLQNVEGNGAGLQHGVVEFADVECRALLLLGFRSQLSNFELAELVREGLTGPDDVAIDFDGDVLIGFAGIVFEKLNRLFPAPAHRVHPGIDDEADRAPHLVRQLAEFRIRIFEEAELFAEAFGIQRPAFDERGVTDVLAELGNVFHFLSERNLQVRSRHRFVQRERLHLPFRPRVQIVGIHEIAARPSDGRRTRLVIGGRLRG